MKVYRVTFSVKDPLGNIGMRHDVPLWVIARSCVEAIKKGRSHGRKHFDDKCPVLKGSVLVGTIDVP